MCYAIAAPVKFDVESKEFKPISIILAPFQSNSPQMAHEAYNVVKNNLSNSGLFRVLTFDIPISIGDIPPFTDLNPDIAVSFISTTFKKEGGDIRLSFRLWDIASKKQVVGQSLSGNKSGVHRRLSHKMSDIIYKTLIGEDYYFDSKIIFVDEQGRKKNKRKRLAIMDQDGANFQYLTGKNEYTISPSYSAFGHKVVYTTIGKYNSSLYLISTLTGTKRKLVSHRNRMIFSPALSPDGQKVAFSMEKNGSTDLYLFDIPSRSILRLTNQVGIDTSPSFSPDGRYLAFNSDRGGNQQIYVMDLKNRGSTKRVSFGDGRYATPRWSPKGDHIAFTKMKNGRFSIGVMTPEGSKERILSTSYLDEAPSWSPNGRALVFFRQSRGHSGHSRLYQVDISGHINERLIQTPHDASDPSWSPLL